MVDASLDAMAHPHTVRRLHPYTHSHAVVDHIHAHAPSNMDPMAHTNPLPDVDPSPHPYSM